MTIDSEQAKEAIKKWHLQSVRSAGIVSLLYTEGLVGIRFEEALKMVKKEVQRLKP